MVTATSLTLLAAGGASQALEGQVATRVKLLVSAGAMATRGELPDAPILADSPSVLSYGARPTQPTFGLGVEITPWELPVALRVSVSRSLAAESAGRWSCAPRTVQQACPDILIEVPTDMTATTGTVDFIGSIPVGRASIHPLGGLSWVRHAYTWDPTPVGSFSLASGNFVRNAAALHLGLGVSVPVGPSRVLAEYTRFYSRNDLARPSRLGNTSFGVMVPIL